MFIYSLHTAFEVITEAVRQRDNVKYMVVATIFPESIELGEIESTVSATNDGVLIKRASAKMTASIYQQSPQGLWGL